MSELGELYLRRKLANHIIAVLRTDPDLRGDERVPEAIAEYERQLAQIDAKIIAIEQEQRRARGEPEPEPITIGLKAASLVGKAL